MNIGVTGHRLDRLGQAELDRMTPVLETLFACLRESTTQLRVRHPRFFADAAPEFRVLSGLAEGSDRHVTGIALASGYSLHGVLPFARDAYAADFTSPESLTTFRDLLTRAERIFEMPGDRAEAERAYEMAGFGLVAHSDVLVAIWDGNEARGPGGTAEVVAAALRRAIPVIHLLPGRGSAPRIIWSRFSPLSVEHENIADYPSVAADEASIAELLQRLLLPADDEIERGFAWRYFAERERQGRTRFEYPLLLALAGVKRFDARAFRVDPYADATAAEWAGFRAGGTQLGAKDDVGLDLLHDAYAWSDNLANHFAQVFRSGHVTNFFLAALAVLFALSGLIWSGAKLWLVMSELTIIVLLVANTHVGRAKQWHRRWLDYRYIAERLRPMRSLVLFGLARPGAANPAADPRALRWTEWYADAIWRQVGCPSGRADDRYRKRLNALVVAEELRPQIRYHEANAVRMEALEHRLHRVGNMLFIATIVACILFLAGYFSAHDWTVARAPLFTALTAALPALGSAIYGIRVQGDFGGTAHRSTRTAHELRAVADALTASTSRFTHAATMAEMGARVMLSDLAEWQVTYRQRNLAIPA